MVPESLIFLSVPDSAVTLASCAAAGSASAAANNKPGNTDRTPIMTRSRRLLGQRRLRLDRRMHLLALPFRHHGGGERIADHVGGGAAHIEELVDADDQQQSGFGQVEARQG